jgi:hypothetical protein
MGRKPHETHQNLGWAWVQNLISPQKFEGKIGFFLL